MDYQVTYKNMFVELQWNAYIIQFTKKNGENRIMLATRNLDICKLKYGVLNGALYKRDERCDITNGNIAVIDLEIGEPRQFSITSLISVIRLADIDDSLAQLDSIDKIDRAIDIVRKIRNKNGDTV